MVPSAGMVPSRRYRGTASTVHCEGTSAELWPHPSTVGRVELGNSSSTTRAFS
jgi:hypothetical protein